MASVPEIILDNPFRVLGVYANSSYREIVASISKATKFMEVDRKVDYPLDLTMVKNLNVKSSLNHSLENLDNALALLSNSEERLKYAQFWFLRMTPLDDKAFNVLFAGEPNNALSVWNKEDNLSSLQNRMILYFWKGDFKPALQKAEQIYKLFPDEFLKAVDSKGILVKSSADLVQSFIDTLVKCQPPSELLDYIPTPFLADLIVPAISEGAITKINGAIQDAKDQLDILNNDGAAAVSQAFYNLGIGGKLLEDTKDEYHLLIRVSSSDNPRLQLVSDSLANMLYECSIDEYNIRKLSPDYSVNLLKNALTLCNNSVDKEEINNKIVLFQKKAGKLQHNQSKDDQSSRIQDPSGILFLFFIILIWAVLAIERSGCY